MMGLLSAALQRFIWMLSVICQVSAGTKFRFPSCQCINLTSEPRLFGIRCLVLQNWIYLNPAQTEVYGYECHTKNIPVMCHGLYKPVYSGKQIVRGDFLIFSSKRSFLFKNRMIDVSVNHLLLHVELNKRRLSCIRFCTEIFNSTL